MWDEEFISNMDPNTACEVASAAYAMDIKPLVDMLCKRIAYFIKGKTAEEIRHTFNIENDLTEAEEAQTRMLILYVLYIK